MPGPVFYFVALVGLVTLAAAAGFVAKPTERNLAVLRPLCAATGFSAVAAFLLGVGNGLVATARWLETGAKSGATDVGPAIARAFAESPAPLVLACAVIAVSWLLVAVGLRRQA